MRSVVTVRLSAKAPPLPAATARRTARLAASGNAAGKCKMRAEGVGAEVVSAALTRAQTAALKSVSWTGSWRHDWSVEESGSRGAGSFMRSDTLAAAESLGEYFASAQSKRYVPKIAHRVMKARHMSC